LEPDRIIPEEHIQNLPDCADSDIAGASESVVSSIELKRNRRKKIVSEILEWIKSIVIALVLALLLKYLVIQAYMIPTGSMEPTIMPRDRVFGNRFIYHFREPARGDIIAFRPPPEAFSEPLPNYKQMGLMNTLLRKHFGYTRVDSYLKRIIAVEGDKIEVKEGLVYLNNNALDEPYIMDKPDYEKAPVTVPKGHVFVMGDNRTNSHDSHIWGFLPKKNIQAKAMVRFWPPNRIGVVR